MKVPRVVAVLMNPVKLELCLTTVMYRRFWNISMAATRWCCVNKLKAVTPIW